MSFRPTVRTSLPATALLHPAMGASMWRRHPGPPAYGGTSSVGAVVPFEAPFISAPPKHHSRRSPEERAGEWRELFPSGLQHEPGASAHKMRYYPGSAYAIPEYSGKQHPQYLPSDEPLDGVLPDRHKPSASGVTGDAWPRWLRVKGDTLVRELMRLPKRSDTKSDIGQIDEALSAKFSKPSTNSREFIDMVDYAAVYKVPNSYTTRPPIVPSLSAFP